MKLYYLLVIFPFFMLLWGMEKAPSDKDSLLKKEGHQEVHKIYTDSISQFHLCAKRGDLEGLAFWLEKRNVAVDAADASGKTALYFALVNDNYKAMLVLITAGANVELINAFSEVRQKIQNDSSIRDILDRAIQEFDKVPAQKKKRTPCYSPRRPISTLDTESDEVKKMRKELEIYRKGLARLRDITKKYESIPIPYIPPAGVYGVLSEPAKTPETDQLVLPSTSYRPLPPELLAPLSPLPPAPQPLYDHFSPTTHLQRPQRESLLLPLTITLGATIIGAGIVLYFIRRIQQSKIQQNTIPAQAKT